MNPEKIEERAAQLFDEGLYCAESVLKALAEACGREDELPAGIATGFCSGMARTAGPCGAVTGAIMALGMESGRDAPGQSVERNYTQVQRLIEEFESRFGFSNCGDLLDCHLGTPAGQDRFRDQDLGARCRGFTGGAAGIAAAIILEAGDAAAPTATDADTETELN